VLHEIIYIKNEPVEKQFVVVFTIEFY